jgi:hypothetical protein
MPTDIHVMMHIGTLLHDKEFANPCAALFFNHSPNKLILACRVGVFIFDVSTQSTQPFSSTPHGAWYCPHALALFDDDAILVAGSSINVCAYDTASLAQLWIHDTVSYVGAVCLRGAHVLVTVYDSSTLLLDYKTGAHIAALRKADGCILGLGVIEGLCFILYVPHILRPPHFLVPRHAAAPPLQASQASASATGDVGLDRKVSRVAVIGLCDGKPIIPLRQSQPQSRWIQEAFDVCNYL